MNRPSTSGFFATLGGASAALLSALVSVFLLSINGAFALVLLSVLAEADNEWLRRDGVQQFGLFTLPLILLVIEWILWDLVRGVFVRERIEEKD